MKKNKEWFQKQMMKNYPSQSEINNPDYEVIAKVKIIDEVLSLVDQIDEPEKPEVPQFLADWFEQNSDDIEFRIYSVHSSISHGAENYNSDIEKWFNNPSNHPIETVIKMKNGYTVIKEELYYLYLPKIGYFGKISSDEFAARTINKHLAKKFTEKEICEIDPKYMLFTIPVEETQ